MSRFLKLTGEAGEPAFVQPFTVLAAVRRYENCTQILIQESAHALYVKESPEEVIAMVEEWVAQTYRGVVADPGPEPDEEP